MTLMERAEVAAKCAAEKNMHARIWEKDSKEIRVYLHRTNAARTEAGYIRIYQSPDGKFGSAYVAAEAAGKGTRTAAHEGRQVLDHYKALRRAAIDAAAMTPRGKL